MNSTSNIEPMSVSLGIAFFMAYVVISIVIGVVSARGESEEDFMIAGRRVRGVQMMATMAAGWFDGVTLSVYFAYIYKYGLPAMSLFVGISFGFILFRHFAPKVKKIADENKSYSMPEYFYRCYGRRVGMMFSAFLIIQFFGYLVINFILSGKVLTHLFPFLGYGGAVIVGGVIILLYLLLAGFKAVIRTDFFQLLIMIIMTVMVAVFLVNKVDITPSDVDIASMGPGNIIGFLVIAGFGVMVAPDIWQRVFAANDERTLKNGFAYTAVILPVLALIIAVAGLATKQFLPNISAEDALVGAFTTLLPSGARELGMVLLYAVSLSSSDTATFVVSAIVTRDLKNYSTKFNHESMKRLTRILMVLFVAIAMVIAIFYQAIIHIALSLGSLNLALFPVVFGSFFWNLRPRAVFWSLVFAMLTVIGLASTATLDPETASLSLPVALVSLLLFQWWFRRSEARQESA